jgi:cytochrome oxidase assembly protein ShyY1
MTQPNNLLTKIFQGVAVLAIAALFVGLGFWQLQRAADLKESLKVARTVDTKVVTLQSVAQPRQPLGEQAFNRTVSFTGKYIANFRAPNQEDGKGVVSDWEVALAQVDERSAILVVRGLWSERLLNPDIQQSMNIDVQGVLVASQFGDRADNVPGVISRLDSAVVVGLTDLDLYDGYIQARAETVRGIALERSRITEEKINPKIPGYYWQHISYVVIWWLMAAVVLYLPLYRRRVTP